MEDVLEIIKLIVSVSLSFLNLFISGRESAQGGGCRAKSGLPAEQGARCSVGLDLGTLAS